MAALASVGLGIIYGLKVNFHVAIVSMVNHTAVGGDGHGGGHDGAPRQVIHFGKKPLNY